MLLRELTLVPETILASHAARSKIQSNVDNFDSKEKGKFRIFGDSLVKLTEFPSVHFRVIAA